MSGKGRFSTFERRFKFVVISKILAKSPPFITPVNPFFAASLLYVIKNDIFVVRSRSEDALIYRMLMQTDTKAIDLVMLVDDNDTDNFISKRIIEITRFASRVEVKGSGKAALDYLKENQHVAGNLPSLIFLDINMPIVDGFVFLYEFEKFNEVVRNKCKVIILSSSDNKRDIDKIVNNNHVIKFITKPLTEVALDEIKLNNM